MRYSKKEEDVTGDSRYSTYYTPIKGTAGRSKQRFKRQIGFWSRSPVSPWNFDSLILESSLT